MFPGFVRYEHMISKASLSNFVFLFLFSLLAHAEETSGMGSAEAKAKDAEESQAIIEQVKAPSQHSRSCVHMKPCAAATLRCR